ncbi:MAG: LON peptidase substrate-binding domain-containing protein [Acidobacteria bacterium]|nr:LON peptidase substrate-binding domain-containing protein [Acidobacteriota bacterium]
MELLRLPPVIPLFPLANHVLLPGLPRPYHIFEPRYRAMVRDLLARPESERWLAIPCVRAEARDDDARPPIHDVATAALLVAHERLPDGRFNIVVYGMERCALEEIDSDRPYRVARASLIAEVDPADKSFSLQSSVDALGQLAARYVASRGGRPRHCASCARTKTSTSSCIASARRCSTTPTRGCAFCARTTSSSASICSSKRSWSPWAATTRRRPAPSSLDPVHPRNPSWKCRGWPAGRTGVHR